MTEHHLPVYIYGIFPLSACFLENTSLKTGLKFYINEHIYSMTKVVATFLCGRTSRESDP